MSESFASPEGYTVTSTDSTAAKMAETFKAPEAEPKPEPKEGGAPQVESNEPPEAGEPPETPPEPAEKPLGKPKNDPRARVMQATRQAAEAKRERDEIERRALAAEAELERLRGNQPEKASKEPAKAEVNDGRPKPDAFENYDDYIEALTDWKLEQRETSQKQQRERQAMIEHQSTMFKAFQSKIEAAIAADPTIDEHISPDVVALVPAGPVDLTKKLSNDDLIGIHFIAEEKGLDMMRHLSDNPDVLQRLRGLSQGSLLIELGRIDARLGSASTAPEPKPTISRARPPVRPVTAAPPSADDPLALPDASLNAVEWGRKREALEERRRKAGR